MSVTLTLLGTGTPRPSSHRAGSGYLVTIGDDHLLFDCGPGVHYRVLEAGLSPIQISHLFLTHLHYDHCGDFPVFELVRWDQGAGMIAELTVVGPEGTKRMSDRLFAEDGVFSADLAARTRHPASIEVYQGRGGKGVRQRPEPKVVEVSDGKSHAGNGWSVTCAQVVHCEPQLITLAYRLDTPAGSIVFGADTSPTSRLIALARGADVLIHMCHFLNQPGVDPRVMQSCSGHLDAATTARDAGVGKLVLVHITPEVEDSKNRERLFAEAASIFSGPIILGEDRAKITLPNSPHTPRD